MEHERARVAAWDVGVTGLLIAASLAAFYLAGSFFPYWLYDLVPTLFICPATVVTATAWASARVTLGARGWPIGLGALALPLLMYGSEFATIVPMR